jgi:hypothetical protein
MAARKRKTDADRQAEWYAAERREWSVFNAKIEPAGSPGQALAIAVDPGGNRARAIPVGGTARNLLAFLGQRYKVPADSRPEEMALYLDLIRRTGASGELKPADLERIERDLSESG